MADKRLDTQKTAIPVVKSPDGQGEVASVNKGADNPIGAGGYDEQQREEGRQRYLDAINGNAKDAAAAQQREDRQRRWSGIVSSISDGITALSNIYFANKGAMAPNVAPNMGANNYRRWRELDALRMQQARIKADDEHRLAELRMRRDAQIAEQRRFDLQQQRVAHESAERMAETQRHNREMERLSGYRTDAGVKRAEDDNRTKVDVARIRTSYGKKNDSDIFEFSDGTRIELGKLSDAMIANLWDKIPLDNKADYIKQDIYGTDRTSKADKLHAIMANKNDANIRKELEANAKSIKPGTAQNEKKPIEGFGSGNHNKKPIEGFGSNR